MGWKSLRSKFRGVPETEFGIGRLTEHWGPERWKIGHCREKLRVMFVQAVALPQILRGKKECGDAYMSVHVSNAEHR